MSFLPYVMSVRLRLKVFVMFLPHVTSQRFRLMVFLMFLHLVISLRFGLKVVRFLPHVMPVRFILMVLVRLLPGEFQSIFAFMLTFISTLTLGRLVCLNFSSQSGATSVTPFSFGVSEARLFVSSVGHFTPYFILLVVLTVQL